VDVDEVILDAEVVPAQKVKKNTRAYRTVSSALGDPPPSVWRREGWDDMPAEFQLQMSRCSAVEQKDRAARLLAARRLYSIMSVRQIALLLNEPVAHVSGASAEGARQDVLAYLVEAFSPKYMEKACTEWANLRSFMRECSCRPCRLSSGFRA